MYAQTTFAKDAKLRQPQNTVRCIICNSRKVDNEMKCGSFRERTRKPTDSFCTQRNVVQRAEINKKTVIEFDPTDPQADEYRTLARAIDGNDMFVVPKPMKQERLEEILMDFGILS